MIFRAGQKVVCIDDKFPIQFWDWADYIPREGAVYTVRWFDAVRHGITGQRIPGILLNEIINPTFGGRGEMHFWTRRFRPVELENERAAESESVILTSQRPSI